MPPSRLCVTEGSINEIGEKRAVVSVPKMRTYVNGTTFDVASLRFTYLGATQAESRLASGASREQFAARGQRV